MPEKMITVSSNDRCEVAGFPGKLRNNMVAISCLDGATVFERVTRLVEQSSGLPRTRHCNASRFSCPLE